MAHRTSLQPAIQELRALDAKLTQAAFVCQGKVAEWLRGARSAAAPVVVPAVTVGGEKCRNLARASVTAAATRWLPVDDESCETDSVSDAGSEVSRRSSVFNKVVSDSLHLACRVTGVDLDVIRDAALRAREEDSSLAHPDKYISNAAIHEALQNGDVSLIKGSWIVKRCANAGVLPCRQDIETRFPSAFWKPCELQELVQSGSVMLVAISHCWLSLDHPDPEGIHLKTLSFALQKLFEGTPLEDAAVFIDWCSLYQRPREEEQQNAFSRALSKIHLWFAHQGVRVWLLPQVPEDSELTLPYEKRGWLTLERCLSDLAPKKNHVLDLGMLDDSCTDWVQITEVCRPKRRPIVDPETFAEELRTKVFSGNPADADFVARKYAKAFKEIIEQAETLTYNEFGWGDAEARQLTTVLPWCKKLRKLALPGNNIGEDGACSLVDGASTCEALEELWLTQNPVSKLKAVKVTLRNDWIASGRDPDALHL